MKGAPRRGKNAGTRSTPPAGTGGRGNAQREQARRERRERPDARRLFFPERTSGSDAQRERRTLRQHSGRGRGSSPVIVAFPRPFARASAPSRNRLPFPAAKPLRAGIPSPRKESFNPLIFAFGGAHCRGFLRETRGNLVGTLTPPPDAERNLFPPPPLEGLRGAGKRVFRATRRRLGFARPTLPPSKGIFFHASSRSRLRATRGKRASFENRLPYTRDSLSFLNFLKKGENASQNRKPTLKPLE